jgi:hypothetical protein
MSDVWWEVPDNVIVPAVWFLDHGIGVFPLVAAAERITVQ